MIRNLANKNKSKTGENDYLLDRIKRIRNNGLKSYNRTQDFPESHLDDFYAQGGWSDNKVSFERGISKYHGK